MINAMVRITQSRKGMQPLKDRTQGKIQTDTLDDTNSYRRRNGGELGNNGVNTPNQIRLTPKSRITGLKLGKVKDISKQDKHDQTMDSTKELESLFKGTPGNQCSGPEQSEGQRL